MKSCPSRTECCAGSSSISGRKSYARTEAGNSQLIEKVKALRARVATFERAIERLTRQRDEAQGGIAYNIAADCDGTLMGGPIWQPDGGMVGRAILLDGIDDYINTNSILNPGDGAFSVVAWIKGGAPGQVIMSQTSGVDWLCADPLEGNLMSELQNSGRYSPLMSDVVITDGNWHRIGFVWDGLNRMLYVDGVKVAEDTQNGLMSSNNGFYIGCGKGMEPGSFFSGLVDDVRIYNRAVHP